MKSTPSADKSSDKLIKSSNQFPVVGIGASAGGLDAFRKLLTAIPENSGVAYVLVQHLDPSHESMLPELLQKVTRIPVMEISDDIKVEPDHIYVIPSNKMMVATDGVLLLAPRPAKNKNEPNLPIDLFFMSLAEVHQSHAIGVVLSGTGSDGTKGLKVIKDHGGITFAQDEASAAYEGMPHSAIQAEVVDFVLPPEEIPRKILEVNRSMNIHGGDDQNVPQQDEEVFKQIISLLRIRKGTDFLYYKRTNIRRRILRRMALNKIDTPSNYLKYLRENKNEQDILYQDLLIPVTSFFRDAKSFTYLNELVFPAILKSKSPGEPIRIWVAGCSTGQEAYSIAISIKEFLADHQQRVQIFATDLSEPAISKARTGIYSKTEMEDITPQRLQDYFSKSNGSYQVNKEIRDMCVFAIHNFLKDPPFGKTDFISCRNVLIYMDPYLQKKALTTFHYSLNPKGFLLLGKSETTSSVPDLFTPAIKSDKLFSRQDVPGRFIHVVSPRSEQNLIPAYTGPKIESIRSDFQKSADEVMLTKYTPAGVVVNESMDIVHFRGNTSAYLEQSPGKPSHNLLKMAKQGLAFELRNILHKAKKEKGQVTKENVPLQSDNGLRTISIEAVPLPNTIDPHYLILFHDNLSTGTKSKQPAKNKTTLKSKTDEKELRIQQLENELEQLHEDMRGITEEQEAANEELQSANEELLSGSEELQSLNEELETSKEELESTNEELTVVNHEILSLNVQVTEARDYAEAIVASIRTPLLVLDKTLRIKSANAAFYKTFQVNETETEGKLIYDLGNREWDIASLRLLLETILPEKSNIVDYEVHHVFNSIGYKIMLLNAHELRREVNTEKLILLAIQDITLERTAIDKIEESEKKFREMAELMPQKIWTADAKGNKNYFNRKWLDYTGLSFEELKDWKWGKLIHPDDWENTKNKWQESIDTGKDYEIEHRLRRKDGKYLWHLTRAIALKDDDGTIKFWLGFKTEIQQQREQKEELEKAVEKRTYQLKEANEDLIKMNEELEAFAYVSSHDLQEPLRKIQTLTTRILEKENENLSDAGKDYFKRMLLSTERMRTLIDDLLSFSRLNTAERKFETIDLNIIIEEIKSEFKDVLEEKQATIEATELCSVNIIPFQFRQLMQNLISNSLKYSKPDQPAHILIKSDIQKGSKFRIENLIPDQNYCHISISDNGIGFEPEFKEKIFEVFQRLHGKEEYSGTGIGLAIVKKIVDNHNGVIIATSNLDIGTTFDIYLPSD